MVVEIYCLEDRIFRIVIHSGKGFWLSILGMIEFNLRSFEFELLFREECDQLITNTVTSSAVCLDYSYAKDWFILLCALAGNHVQCLTRLFCLRFDLGHAAIQCHISEIYTVVWISIILYEHGEYAYSVAIWLLHCVDPGTDRHNQLYRWEKVNINNFQIKW